MQYNLLSCARFAEKAVLCHFTVLAVLWMTRDLGTAGGWGKLFQPGYAAGEILM